MDELLTTDAQKPSLKRLGGAFVGLLQNHLELISIEIQEEKSRTFRLFLFSGLCLILALMVLLGLSTALIIAFWDSYRMTATLGLCAVYGVALVFCAGKALRLAHEAQTPFQATVEELARSREQLRP